jgi:cytidylate kinase
MVVIAIDGPGGSGKSTISRAVAHRLGLAVLDTGAMYRALTLLALRLRVEPSDAARLAELAKAMELSLEDGVTLDGEDVGDAIRSAAVDATVSTVAAHPAVRAELVRRQQDWVATHEGGVVEGRDITSVVLPDADVKVYLTASPEERARRRALQRDEEEELEVIEAQIATRDHLDSARAVSPLRVSADAVVIDSTGRDVDAVVEQIVGLL